MLAQNAPPQLASGYVATRKTELVQQFSEFLSIPNVAADPVGLRRNADYLIEQLKKRGMEAKLLTSPELPASVPPVVYGEIRTPGAKHTLVFLCAL